MQLMKWGLKPCSRKFMACMVALIMFCSLLGLGNPGTVSAKTEDSDPAVSFTVTLSDPGTNEKIELFTYSIDELLQMPQAERAYSSIDSLPAPVFTAARGIDLTDFLETHKFDMDSIEQFKFRATDFDADNYPPTFGKVFNASDLLDSDRHYFPQIQACWAEYWDEAGNNPSNPSVLGYWENGSEQYTRAGATPVRPMLGIISFQARAIASDVGETVYLEPQFELMDGTTALRICYGQKDPGECSTMNFLRWTYKMEVTGKLLPMTLTADTSYNRVGRPIEISFPYNIAWQHGITAVSVGDKLLDQSQYTVSTGKITIGAAVFDEAGTYNVKVSSGFSDSAIEQEITEASASDPLVPPALTADSSNNCAANSIDISFADDAAWRNAITEVRVDGQVLAGSKYSKTEAGKISIDGSVFAAAGLYSITIQADGYEDASLKQILKNSGGPPSLESIEISKPAAKLLYSVGDTLDISGLEVSGHYSDGSSKLEAISPANISGFDSSQPAARQILNISIGGKLSTYEVNIAKVLTAAENGSITIEPGIPVSISLPEGLANTEIQVPQNTALALLKVESSQVDMTIPNGTTVTGSDIIKLPEVKPGSSVSVAGAQMVNLLIELGSELDTISFSKPVRLLLKGQGGKTAGFIDNAGKFYKIAKLAALAGLGSDSDADSVAAVLANAGVQEGAVTYGQDLVIWTKHFTKFLAYTAVSSPSNPITPTMYIEEFITVEQAVRKQTISSRGGIIKIWGAILDFPAQAISDEIEVSIKKLSSGIPSIPAGFKLLGEVYEITSNKENKFTKPVIITLPFDKDKVDSEKYDAAVYCWNDKEWLMLEQAKADMTAGKVSGEAAHFSKFAVLLSEKGKIPVTVPAIVPAVKKVLSDIRGHWAEVNISRLVNAGFISGYPDSSFKPDKSISRAEFAAVLAKAFELEPKSGKVFSDTSGHWARDSISSAAVHGIVSGYDESSFGPDDLITREQMAVMIKRAAGLSAGDGKTFADSARIADWAKEAVTAASGRNIISGYPDHTFGPQANASRAEAVTVIVNALNTRTAEAES